MCVLPVAVFTVVLGGVVGQHNWGNPGASTDVLQERLVTPLAKPPTMPPRQVGAPLGLNVSFSLIDVVNARKRNNEVDIILWVSMHWNDARLKWNPDEFNNTTQLIVPSSSVWTPDFVPYKITRPVEEMFPAKVVIGNDGRMTYMPALRLTIPCDIKRAKGKASCTMKWGSWTTNGDVMDIKVGQQGGTMDVTSYFEDSMFDVKSSKVTQKTKYYVCCPEPYQEILASFSFKAKNDKMNKP